MLLSFNSTERQQIYGTRRAAVDKLPVLFCGLCVYAKGEMLQMTVKSEKTSNPIMPSKMVLPTVDMEYLYRFERTVAGLEKGLHNDDDPEEIAMQTIEVARDFYDADWCGIISGDLDVGIFYPYWWANRAEGRMAKTKFDEFEFPDDYDTWAQDLKNDNNIVLDGLSQKKMV
jgi:hypothetical protein